MGYDKLVYSIGKLYGQHLEDYPYVEFPEFSGQVADLVDEASLMELLSLQGEYIIAYNNGSGTRHFIRLYLDEGTFEVAGTPEIPNIFGLSSTTHQD